MDAVALVGSAAVLVIVGISCFLYRRINAMPPQPEGAPIRALPGFRVIYVPIQFIVVVAAFSGILFDWPILLTLWASPVPALAGVLIAAAGMALFVSAVRTLGQAYSPCYASHVPPWLVQHGPYRLIRHPMYTANLTVLIGLFVASGSLWILLALLIVTAYYGTSAHYEERALAQAFPEYVQYRSRTGRFLPRLFIMFCRTA